MTDLMPYDNESPAPRRAQSRQLSRSLGAVSAQAHLKIARIEAAAEVQSTRVDAITYVARRGLQNVAMLTQLEQQLATLVPLASGRLAAIGDIAALSIAEVVTDTAHRVR